MQLTKAPPARPPFFIAMEYKGMLNCIYKIYITDSLVLGAKVNGYITVQPNFGLGTSIPFKVMHDPEAYVNKKKDEKYENLLNDPDAFLKTDKQNFIIRISDIKQVYHDPTPKWGMGYYPHTGKIMVEASKTTQNAKAEREFILVGDQNPSKVLALFQKP
ncbi:MAG TPA: hypothetical protein VGH64_10310 [Puia sp.]|jgi:hypothetical protein